MKTTIIKICMFSFLFVAYAPEARADEWWDFCWLRRMWGGCQAKESLVPARGALVPEPQQAPAPGQVVPVQQQQQVPQQQQPVQLSPQQPVQQQPVPAQQFVLEPLPAQAPPAGQAPAPAQPQAPPQLAPAPGSQNAVPAPGVPVQIPVSPPGSPPPSQAPQAPAQSGHTQANSHFPQVTNGSKPPPQQQAPVAVQPQPQPQPQAVQPPQAQPGVNVAPAVNGAAAVGLATGVAGIAAAALQNVQAPPPAAQPAPQPAPPQNTQAQVPPAQTPADASNTLAGGLYGPADAVRDALAEPLTLVGKGVLPDVRGSQKDSCLFKNSKVLVLQIYCDPKAFRAATGVSIYSFERRQVAVIYFESSLGSTGGAAPLMSQIAQNQYLPAQSKVEIWDLPPGVTPDISFESFGWAHKPANTARAICYVGSATQDPQNREGPPISAPPACRQEYAGLLRDWSSEGVGFIQQVPNEFLRLVGDIERLMGVQ